jgi:hypothetical protein
MAEALPAPVSATTDVERVLAFATVRDAVARGAFLSAVRELGRDNGRFTEERLRDLIRVEDHFQALLLHGELDFLHQPVAPSDAERDFALNIQRICLESANGFQRFLRNRASWARDRDALDVMYQVTGLAMNAIHCCVKWGYFLNESSHAMPWKQLHALYALAEGDGYATAPFVLHASQPDFAPTVEALYLRALLLEVLNSGNLTTAQVEIADGWLASWCRDYALEREGVPARHYFFVDLASESGLRPFARSKGATNPRFLNAETIPRQIEAMQASLRQGRPQAACGAGAAFPIEEHAALLDAVEKLRHSIVTGGTSRVEERTPFPDREVDVAAGIERVMRKVQEAPGHARARSAVAGMQMLDASEAGLSALVADPLIASATVEEPAADPDVERWRVQDLSVRGYGLLVDRAAAELALLNGIVALRNQETGGWIVGTIVRKHPNRGRGEFVIGVDVLSYRPIAIELTVDGAQPITALFLPGTDAGGKDDSLLMPLGDFRSGSRFAIRVRGARYRVRLNRIIRKGADWISARYEIESKA